MVTDLRKKYLGYHRETGEVVDMSDYKIETKCIQSGYTPENGEPRVLPIYQSTTFKYETQRADGTSV